MGGTCASQVPPSGGMLLEAIFKRFIRLWPVSAEEMFRRPSEPRLLQERLMFARLRFRFSPTPSKALPETPIGAKPLLRSSDVRVFE